MTLGFEPRKWRVGAAGTRGGPTGRAGISAVELLVALLIGAVLLQAVWSLMAGQRIAAADLRSIAEGLEAERIVRTVLRGETRAGVPARDWSVPSSGVLLLRAFRGWATVCGEPAPGTMVVRYQGMRMPDPVKDSLLILDYDGRWHAVDLLSRARTQGRCATGSGGDPDETWRVEPPVSGGIVVRLFERASYHLTDGVLRYRRGLGGRQPLTTPVLDPTRSGIEAVPDGARMSVGVIGREGGWSRPLSGNRIAVDGSG